MKIKFFLSDNEMAPTTISDNLFADSLINRGYNVEKVISYKRKKEIIEKEDADIIIFQKKILPGHKYQDIYKLKGKVDEIIVVDNGSTNETINMLKALEDEITVIYLNENKGIASALNKGIDYSIKKGYQWVLTFDHDSIVTEDMIINMLNCYKGLNSNL